MPGESGQEEGLQAPARDGYRDEADRVLWREAVDPICGSPDSAVAVQFSGWPWLLQIAAGDVDEKLYTGGQVMTSEEYAEKQEQILMAVPKEFWGPMSYYAYERSHAYGMEETLNTLVGLVSDIGPAIKEFELRIRGEK